MVRNNCLQPGVRTWHRATVALVGLLAIVLVGLTTLSAGEAKVKRAANPHWKKDACESCHRIENGKKLPISAATADEVCLKCHDGVQAAGEFHPVGREFDEKLFIRPKNWPLAQNRLGCLTCHDMLAGCDEAIGGRVFNSKFLRDFEAGRTKSKPFCRNCHQESAYKKINPHQMMLPEKDEVVEEKCLFCHNKPLDRKTMARTGKPALKMNEMAMCRDCHPRHKDPMPSEHLGVKLSEEMLAHMYAREVIGLAGTVGSEFLAQAKAEKRLPTKMVPSAEKTITCSTCHNPHQAGVFPQTSVMAFRAMRPTSEGKLASPVRGQQWCKHCHEF